MLELEEKLMEQEWKEEPAVALGGLWWLLTLYWEEGITDDRLPRLYEKAMAIHAANGDPGEGEGVRYHRVLVVVDPRGRGGDGVGVGDGDVSRGVSGVWGVGGVEVRGGGHAGLLVGSRA